MPQRLTVKGKVVQNSITTDWNYKENKDVQRITSTIRFDADQPLIGSWATVTFNEEFKLNTIVTITIEIE
jgi:hypothetical protein